jgi:hypothetical protein
MNHAQHSLSLVKGAHRYVFRYSEGCEARVLASFVSLAVDPETSFDWFDAAVLSYQMGRTSRPGRTRVRARAARPAAPPGGSIQHS